MTTPNKMQGVVVSESEAAAGLGFASVDEFRRWQTEQGQRVWELEAKLREVTGERDRFQWHGKRMQKVLERVREALPENAELRLAVGVVLAKEVDWNHVLTWLDG